MSFLKMSGKADILFRSLCSVLSLPLPSDPLFLMWKFKIQSHVSSFKNMLWGVWDGRVHTAILKWITKKDLLSSTGNSRSALRGSLDGRGVWGRMDPCICTAESLRSSPETITTLFVNQL